MDEMRERLTELIDDVLSYQPWGEICSHTAYECADYLIANGVTVQEPQKQESKGVEIDQFNKWIPVTERLPKNYEAVLTFDGRSIHIMAHHHDFKDPFGIAKGNFMGYAPITYWMPLPEPPKGE